MGSGKVGEDDGDERRRGAVRRGGSGKGDVEAEVLLAWGRGELRAASCGGGVASSPIRSGSGGRVCRGGGSGWWPVRVWGREWIRRE